MATQTNKKRTSCIMRFVTSDTRRWTSRPSCWHLWIHIGSSFHIREAALALMSVSASETGLYSSVCWHGQHVSRSCKSKSTSTNQYVGILQSWSARVVHRLPVVQSV